MKSFFQLLGLLILGAVAFAVYAEVFREPQITYDQRLFEPTCVRKAKKGDLKYWPIDQQEVTIYEYVKGPTVTSVDGRWFSLNGIARSWARKQSMKVGGKLYPIEEIETLRSWKDEDDEQSARNFQSDLNDIINKTCPQ